MNSFRIINFSRNAVYSSILERSANSFRIIDFSRNDEYSFVGRSNSIKRIFFFFLIYISYRISQETRILFNSRTKRKLISNHRFLKKHEYCFILEQNTNSFRIISRNTNILSLDDLTRSNEYFSSF